MKPAARAAPPSAAWLAFKWSLMSGTLFWTLVFKLSERGLQVPDFVYVNF